VGFAHRARPFAYSEMLRRISAAIRANRISDSVRVQHRLVTVSVCSTG
jgi:hypothetical protein